MWRACLPISLLVLNVGCDGGLSVPMAAPVADAGFDQLRHVVGGASLEIVLDGRASCDPMGDGITGASWSVVSAPAGAPEPSADELLTAAFQAAEPGEYIVSLVVTAGDRASEPDYLSVRVIDADGDDITVAPPATDACGQPIDGA